MDEKRAAVRWAGRAACAGFCILVVACTGATTTPINLVPHDTEPIPTYQVATPSPTPTRRPDPTWTAAEKGQVCRALASLATAGTEATAAYEDADTGRWDQALAHVENLVSQGQAAEYGFHQVEAAAKQDGLPYRQFVASLREVAGQYVFSGQEVAWGIEHEGTRDVSAVKYLVFVGVTAGEDMRQLEAGLGGC